jgi:hypothetical protein
MPEWEPNAPNALNNQRITMTTTTTFRIFLIFPSIGMYVLISHSTTPTMMRRMSNEMRDIILAPILYERQDITVYQYRKQLKGHCLFGGYNDALSACSGVILVYGRRFLVIGTVARHFHAFY